MNPAPTTVAVVICAYTETRLDTTLLAMASARAQAPAPDELVVVVDHNEPLRDLLDAAGIARVIPSTGPRGLSGARNTGVAATTSEVVAFLDDDAVAAPGWLAALVAPFADGHVLATGSRIVPAFRGTRPPWLPGELDWVVGCTYAGMTDGRDEVRNVIGAAMAVRRTAVDAVGGFHTSMGRGLGLPVGGEETELCIRLRRWLPDAKVVHVPSSVVRHRVGRERTTFGYLLRRSWAEGVTKARVSRIAGHGDGLETERRYMARVLPGAALREMRGAVADRRPGRALGAVGILGAVGAAGLGLVAETARGLVAETARGLVKRPLRAPSSRAGASGTPDAVRSSRLAPAADGERPLRILMVTARFAPLVGGVETHTLEVGRRLAARGHRVAVATTDPDGSLPPRESIDGIDVVRVAAWPRGRDWYLAPGLLGIVGRRRWDIVHVQGVHTLVPPIAGLAAILMGRHWLLTFHSGGHSSRLRTSMRSLQWRAIAPFLRRADVLVGVSRFERDRFAAALGVDPARIPVIRNGGGLPTAAGAAPTPVMDAADTRAKGHGSGNGHEPAATADGPRILSLGRLERYKGHHRAIEAMPALRATMPAARLHVAGAGPDHDRLVRLTADLGLEDSVTIGAIPREEMTASLADTDLVVLLSDYEAHPVAVAEALAAGCRVLTADTTGFRELAEEGLVRAIPPDSGPVAVAAAIAEALAAPAPDGPPDLPTWDDTTDALEALYRRIVAGA